MKARFIIGTLLIVGIMGFCTFCVSQRKAASSMSDKLSKMKTENPNYSEKDLQFIETSLIKAKIIKSHQDLVASGLRLFVEEQNATQFFVHIGSADPYKGGSGATYSVGKADGAVKLQSTETYEPAPERPPNK